MTTLQDKLDNIYQTKLEIKSALGTDSDVFSEYPGMIRSMAGGGVSYSYLDERLSYYVETSDLESMGYATESYVTNAISSIPGVDLSSYVTYSYADSHYVSYGYIGDLNEISEYILGPAGADAPENVYATKYELGSYVSKNELNSAGYISSIPNTYATYAAIEAMGYATESYVTNAISNIPSVDTSSYVTYTYLESKEYITINDVPVIDTSSYVTYSYLDSCGYVTSNDLPVINESIIPKAPHTYTLGDSSHFYDELYVNRSYCGVTYFTTSSYIHPISSSQVNLDLTHNIFSFSNDSLFTENADLGKHDKYWNNGYISNTYSDKFYLNNADITYIFPSYSYVNEAIAAIPVVDENIIPKENNTYTLGDSSHLYNATYTSNISLGSHQLKQDEYSIGFNINGNNTMRMFVGSFRPWTDKGATLGSSTTQWSTTYTSNIYADNAYTYNNYLGSSKIYHYADNNIYIDYANGKRLIINPNTIYGSSGLNLGTNNLPINNIYMNSTYIHSATYLPVNTYWWNGTSYVWLGSLFT